ncbi:nucleotidyltransferase domain-containing protein [Candidatus Micrarchaeota archaeon]|nr:nucleotidyltransferase domain-containing protein [Candidatus Micrarchaeota archaeon]
MLENYAFFKALKTVQDDPRKRFSVRELAREAGLSASSAKACLDSMNASGLVALERIGATYQYSFNLANPLARQWKILFNVQALEAAGLFGHLLKESRGISSIVLYGSMANGTNDGHSDVDLLVIDRSKSKFSLSRIEAKLGREVNLLVQTPFEWKEKANKEKVFYDNVIVDSIAVFGRKPVVL